MYAPELFSRLKQYALQPIYSSTDCISSKMCILVLTDMVQCWMYNFMVLTAATTSSSALILRNHSESRPGPLLFSHRSLMLDYPLTLYSISHQYVQNVKDYVCTCVSDICELTVTDYQQHLNWKLDLILFITSQKGSEILHHVGIFISGTDT